MARPFPVFAFVFTAYWAATPDLAPRPGRGAGEREARSTRKSKPKKPKPEPPLSQDGKDAAASDPDEKDPFG